ncbi:MAG TPA: HAD-IA family hydrolase [Thermomicrobiales bacterium]|nr:HAD-IA family hydrolase [Thermomicrobiales bacterium]
MPSRDRHEVPIDALVFDMDGLLVDSEPLADTSMKLFLQRHGHTAREEYGPALLGRRLPEAVALFVEWYGLQGNFDDLVAELDQLRTEMITGNLSTMPGAAEIIDFGRQAGLRLALATSNRRHQATISLEETGLTGLFDAEVTGDEVKRGKPAPDIFALAAERIGVDPVRCVVFEDAPAGVAAAAAAGMRSVFVPSGYSVDAELPIAPTITVSSLFDGIEWLRGQGVGSGVPE